MHLFTFAYDYPCPVHAYTAAKRYKRKVEKENLEIFFSVFLLSTGKKLFCNKIFVHKLPLLWSISSNANGRRNFFCIFSLVTKSKVNRKDFILIFLFLRLDEIRQISLCVYVCHTHRKASQRKRKVTTCPLLIYPVKPNTLICCSLSYTICAQKW